VSHITERPASVTVPRPPWRIRTLNTIGPLLRRFGASNQNLDPDHLLQASQKLTGLGPDANPECRPALLALVDSYERDAELTSHGRTVIRMELVRILATRLRMADAHAREPTLRQTPITRPLFITGLARSGTTFLHHLLNQDIHYQALRFWELLSPVPPPRPGIGVLEPRAETATTYLERDRWCLAPMDVIHATSPHSLEDCGWLLNYTLVSSDFVRTAPIRGYLEWFLKQDLTPSYRSYRASLQLLRHHFMPCRLVLKGPSHMVGLDALLATFPDAGIVQIHRDPARTLPSLCHMLTVFYRRICRGQNSRRLGAFAIEWVTQMLKRAQATREAAPANTFLDVAYTDLVTDPQRTVRRVYEHFGIEQSPQSSQALARYLTQDRAIPRRRHDYQLRDFGLEADALRHRFADYIEAYSICAEPHR